MSKLELYDVSFEGYFGYIVWARSEEDALLWTLDHGESDTLEHEIKERMMDENIDVSSLDLCELEEEHSKAFMRALKAMSEVRKLKSQGKKPSMVYEYTLNF